MSANLSKITKNILGIFAGTFILSILSLFLYFIFLRNPVVDQVNLSQVEKELCQKPFGRASNILEVTKCTRENNVIYRKYTSDLYYWSSQKVTYYDENGNALCWYGLSMGGCDDFNQWEEDCEWELGLICTNDPATQ